MLGLEKFKDGWPIETFFSGVHEWGQSMQKRLMLVYEGSLYSTKATKYKRARPHVGEML